MAAESRFWEFWMRKTIRNVTIVVPVLITSCQVSENWKNGPVIAHTTTVPSASAKTQARPTSREVAFATSANSLFGVREFLAGGTRIGVLEPFFRSEYLMLALPLRFPHPDH